MSFTPIVTAPSDGDVLRFSPTELLTWKATQATTGAFDQLTLTAQPGHAGAPEHVHSGTEECFFVLDGAFRFKVADSIVVAEPGTARYQGAGRGERPLRHRRRRPAAARRTERPTVWRSS